MAGKNPRTAVDNFLRPIRKSLACVTSAIIARSPGEKEDLQAFTLNNGEPVQLGRKTPTRAPLFVRIEQQYRVRTAPKPRGPWKVETAAYQYILEDDDGREILAFHWHPMSTIRYPHLHLGVSAQVGRDELQDAHIPTGRVSLEGFLQLLIEVFEIRARPGWKDVLRVSHVRFEKWSSWD